MKVANRIDWRGTEMGFGYDIGNKVIQIEGGVIGKVIKIYKPTAAEWQTMILCDDGRKYHAPSDTFIKVSEMTEEIAKKIKSRPPQLAMEAGFLAGKMASQPLLVPCDYRNIKATENLAVTIDLEDLKKQLVESHYKLAGLNYGA